MNWLVLYFSFFAVISSEFIQIEMMRRHKAFDLYQIKEIYFLIDKTYILDDIVVKKSVIPIQINRNRVQTTIENILEQIIYIDKLLVDVVYSFIDSILQSYNNLTYAYLCLYYEELITNERWLTKTINSILFERLNPNDAFHNNSLFTFLSADKKDVMTIFDNFLLYAPRFPKYGKLKDYLDILNAESKRYKSNNICHNTVILNNVFVDDHWIVQNKQWDTGRKLKKLLDVFSDFYVAYMRKHYFYSHSYTEIKALNMFMYNELKCNVRIKSAKQDESKLKTLEKWNCGPDLEAENFGFISLSRENKKRSLKPFSFVNYAKSKNTSTKMQCVVRSIQYLVSKIELRQTEKKELATKAMKVSLDNGAEETIADEKYHNEYYNMSLKELDDWVILNYNTINLLALNYITVELMIQTVGLISSNLLHGAEHILYKYCLKLEKLQDTYNSVQNIRILRTYLIIFYSLLKELKSLINYITIVITSNIYFKRMEENLTKMVEVILIKQYDGDNDYLKMQKMKAVVLKEYGEIHISSSNIDDWKIKKDYILSPTILLSNAVDLLFKIHSKKI